jgi:uncharacterized protein (TIGR01777 family)
MEQSMRILIAGAGGMIGSVVAPYLAAQGHDVVRLVRREPAAGEIRWDPDSGEIDAARLEGFDGVVNLATMPWPMRWTSRNKQMIHANRMATNSLLADTLAQCKHRPRVLVCASGMGIYAPGGDRIITEDDPPGSDFLATLQRDGEAAALRASEAGIRVVNLRIPAVLGGGSLRRHPGRKGSGQQWSSWVSRDELARIVNFVLLTDALEGPVNPVSPNPVRQAGFVAIFSRVMGTRPGPSIPAFLLRMMLGEMADALILASRRILPARLLAAGYSFCYPEMEGALRHELGDGI